MCSCQKYPTTLSKASTEMRCPHHTSSGPVGEGLQEFSQVRKPKASPAPTPMSIRPRRTDPLLPAGHCGQQADLKDQQKLW